MTDKPNTRTDATGKQAEPTAEPAATPETGAEAPQARPLAQTGSANGLNGKTADGSRPKQARKKPAGKTDPRKRGASAQATAKPPAQKASPAKASATRKSAGKTGPGKAAQSNQPENQSSEAEKKQAARKPAKQAKPKSGRTTSSRAQSSDARSLAHHATHPPAKDREARPRKRANPAAAKSASKQSATGTSAPAVNTGKGKANAKARKSAGPMAVVDALAELRTSIADLRSGKATTVALVPTMGALHDGHLTLVKQALEAADHVIVSIFVNPTQFAPHEDLDTYPRDMDGDLSKLDKLGVRLVWAPERSGMYPDGFATRVRPAGVASGLEADARPHFFEGVTTIVSKLFNQVRPDIAIFGEKDYQQLCVIRQLNRDLDFGIDIRSGPTVREDDGLALSSRNAYLNEAQRKIAPELHRILEKVAESAGHGEDCARLKADAKMELLTAGFSKVDYLEVRDAETLASFDPASGRAGRVLAAAWLKSTRLIDNVPVKPASS